MTLPRRNITLTLSWTPLSDRRLLLAAAGEISAPDVGGFHGGKPGIKEPGAIPCLITTNGELYKCATASRIYRIIQTEREYGRHSFTAIAMPPPSGSSRSW